MRWIGLVCVIVSCVLAGCSSSWEGNGTSAVNAPRQEIEGRYKCLTGSGHRAGQTTNGFFGMSRNGDTHTFHSWRWEGATPKKNENVEMPHVSGVVNIPLPNNKYLSGIYASKEGHTFPLVLGSFGSNEVIKKWAEPKGWEYTKGGVSRNRRFAVVFLEDDFTAPDHDFTNPNLRVGFVDIAARELSWVIKHRGRIYGVFRDILVSNDGKYIAIAGWTYELVLVDVKARRKLWAKRPPNVVNLSYAAFSSDGSVLYAADSGDSGVFMFETATGKVIRKWYASPTGESIYGHRISCLAISPDDAWIAVGTGPQGLVFLFSTTSPESKPIILPHGSGTTDMLSFSPDSRYLATMRSGQIKIWDVIPPDEQK